MVSATVFGVAALAMAVAFYYVGPSVRIGPDAVPLVEFIENRTDKDDRLAIQAIGRFGRITHRLKPTTMTGWRRLIWSGSFGPVR